VLLTLEAKVSRVRQQQQQQLTKHIHTGR
jgi:hypothetical protein